MNYILCRIENSEDYENFKSAVDDALLNEIDWDSIKTYFFEPAANKFNPVTDGFNSLCVSKQGSVFPTNCNKELTPGTLLIPAIQLEEVIACLDNRGRSRTPKEVARMVNEFVKTKEPNRPTRIQCALYDTIRYSNTKEQSAAKELMLGNILIDDGAVRKDADKYIPIICSIVCGEWYEPKK